MEIEAQGERVAVSEKQRSGSALQVLALIMRHSWSCREHITYHKLVYLPNHYTGSRGERTTCTDKPTLLSDARKSKKKS